MLSVSTIKQVSTSRRDFLRRFGFGIGGSAFAYLCNQDKVNANEISAPHMPVRAKSVIFLYMCGGVSHIDTFDPKGNRWAGKMMEITGSNNGRTQKRPVIHCPRVFTRYGESGIPVCEWFPHVGGVIDEIAVVRSMTTPEIGHFQAAIQMSTGHRRRTFDHPSLGAWVSYSLGSANNNLPTYVNMGRPLSPLQTAGGYFGASEAATPFQASGPPLRNLQIPKSISSDLRQRQMNLLSRMNGEFHHRYAMESEISARVRSYELAARLQTSAPEAVDIRNEPKYITDLYGIDNQESEPFGRQALIARRLVERGVRFVQICHGGKNNGDWDSHDSVEDHAPLCRQTDKPIAGLIKDLKQRGLLDSTLVVWASEFGRTPWSQNTVGRDHNPHGFSVWLAGGGVQGGRIHGATDEIGLRAVENPHGIGDLQATILQQMGLNYTEMEVEVNGAPAKIIDECEGPIDAILA
jgi:hypothetical protein